MICEKHKIDPSLCPHRWNELISAVQSGRNDTNRTGIDYNIDNLDLNDINDCKKLLSTLTVHKIARKLLKRKDIKVKNKDDSHHVKDLGFSGLQNITLLKHTDIAPMYHKREKSKDNFKIKRGRKLNSNYLELGLIMDFNNIQILPPIYTPSVYNLYNYSN